MVVRDLASHNALQQDGGINLSQSFPKCQTFPFDS